jgi:hypothetical protein
MTDFAIKLTCIEQTDANDNDSNIDAEPEKFILYNGVIRQRAYAQITSLKSFAEEYLNLIRTDQINLDWQTQHLVLLDQLDRLIKGKQDFRALASLFREAMLALAQNASQKLSEIQDHEQIEDAVQHGYDYYGFNGLTDSAVTHARRAAVQGMIRKFASQYSAEGGYKGDLYGSYHLDLTNPRIKDVIPWLDRSYLEDGRLSTKISHKKTGTWAVEFIDLIPFNDLNRLNLAIETYRAAIPILECALEMDAAIYWALSE